MNKTKSKVMLGMLAGAAAGAIAGVLFAPGAGKSTRKQLVNKGRETVEDLKSKADNLAFRITEDYLSGNPEDFERLSEGSNRIRSGAYVPGSTLR